LLTLLIAVLLTLLIAVLLTLLIAVLLTLLIAAVLYGNLLTPRSSSPNVSTPTRIAGGSFEASGVAYVPGTNDVLFVDDNQYGLVLAMRLAADGTQLGPPTPIPLGVEITDAEGMTFDGTYFYIVGSQSKSSGFDGPGLARFTYNSQLRRIENLETVSNLKAFLAAHVTELAGVDRRIGDYVLNIEGLAWDPVHQRLLLGLRAPVIANAALVIPLKFGDPQSRLSAENIYVENGQAIRLPLGGAGIRSLEYDAGSNAFWLITGASLNDEKLEFRWMEWREGGTIRQLSTFSRKMKPEGITPAFLDGHPVTVMVFDTSQYLVLR
jgi:hypothetical protein